jgi:hypothetical protein
MNAQTLVARLRNFAHVLRSGRLLPSLYQQGKVRHPFFKGVREDS